jgi:hypothetical protein
MRRPSFSRSLIGLVALVALAVGIGAAPEATAQLSPPWTVTVLRPLVEGDQTEVHDINRAGTAVGTSGGKPVVWAPDGTPTALPMKQGVTNGIATAINDHGIIVGVSPWLVAAPEREALAWVYGTTVTLSTNADVHDINNRNVVAGCQGGTNDAGRRPFVALVGYDPIPLSTDAGTPTGCANALTEWGGVAGYQRDNPAQGSFTGKGRLWYQDQTFNWTGTPQHVSEVTDLSDSGYSLLRIAALGSPTLPTHSAIGAPDGSYQVLDPIRAGSDARDINVYGIAVGVRTAEGGETIFGPAQSVLWAYGTTVPLYTLAWDARYPMTSSANADAVLVGQSYPSAVSDSFRIAGNKVAGNASTTSWVLTPPS